MMENPAPAWKGLQTGQMPRFLSYDQIERMIGSMLDHAALWQPSAVAAITRGGLVPGTMAACMLALPLCMIGWNRKSDVTDWIGPPADGKRVLLVDDCCATGQTMRSVKAALQQQGYDCATLTIVHDPETTAYIPDFSHPMTELFRFPWERGEATPASRLGRATGAPADRATEQPFYGLDLDGVFLPDIPRSEYLADLAESLRRRHELPLYSVLPAFPRERCVVITGRPEIDRGLTEAWLARWGFSDLGLECRPHDVNDDVLSVTRYKATAATRLGCTHFVESDAEQAVRIAAHAPHLVVSWWCAAQARAWTIGAAASPGTHDRLTL